MTTAKIEVIKSEDQMVGFSARMPKHVFDRLLAQSKEPTMEGWSDQLIWLIKKG